MNDLEVIAKEMGYKEELIPKKKKMEIEFGSPRDSVLKESIHGD